MIALPESNGPWGTSPVDRPSNKSLGVNGFGSSGSDPVKTPIGLEFRMFAISNKIVCNSANVKTFDPILCRVMLG